LSPLSRKFGPNQKIVRFFAFKGQICTIHWSQTSTRPSYSVPTNNNITIACDHSIKDPINWKFSKCNSSEFASILNPTLAIFASLISKWSSLTNVGETIFKFKAAQFWIWFDLRKIFSTINQRNDTCTKIRLNKYCTSWRERRSTL
jgi:hypothetical protein